jgi:hypothetical protein
MTDKTILDVAGHYIMNKTNTIMYLELQLNNY